VDKSMVRFENRTPPFKKVKTAASPSAVRFFQRKTSRAAATYGGPSLDETRVFDDCIS